MISEVSDPWSFWTLKFLGLEVSEPWSFWPLKFLSLEVSDPWSFWTLKFLSPEVSELWILFDFFFFFWDLKKIKETDKKTNKRIYCFLSKHWLIQQQLPNNSIATSKYSTNLSIDTRIIYNLQVLLSDSIATIIKSLILKQKVLILRNIWTVLQMGFLSNSILYFWWFVFFLIVKKVSLLK